MSLLRIWMIRALVLGVLAAIALLTVGVERLARTLYEMKVLPVEEEMQAAGLYPAPRTPSSGSASDFVRLGGLALLPRDGREVSLCRGPGDHAYWLRVEGQAVELEYARLEKRLPTFLSEMPSPDAQLGPWGRAEELLSRHPLLEPSQELAGLAARFGEPDFSPFTPLGNLARLSSKIRWVITIPRGEKIRSKYEVRQATLAGTDGFGFVELDSHPKNVFLTASFTRDGEEFRFYAGSAPTGGEARAIVSGMFDTIQLADAIAEPAPPCAELAAPSA